MEDEVHKFNYEPKHDFALHIIVVDYILKGYAIAILYISFNYEYEFTLQYLYIEDLWIV